MSFHRYLDELVEMMTYNLIGRHSWEHLHVLSNKDVMRPHQGNPRIFPNSRRSGVNLLLLLVPNSLPFTPRINLLNWSVRRSSPHCFGVGSGRSCCSDGAALLHHPHSLSPKTRQGLVLFGPHPSIHTLVKFSCHSYKRKALVKKKKNFLKKREKGRNDELNTYTFSP